MNRSCIACGCHITHPIYHPEDKPLAALHLPRNREDAREVLTYPMDFRACAVCGHIFNVDFDYHKVPYEDNSNLMYNNSLLWRHHLAGLRDHMIDVYHAYNSTILDIGCGDGGFLAQFLDRSGLGNRYVGFEPGVEAENAAGRGIEMYKDYFVARRDLARMRPDFIVCRHVLEHLENPREFVAEISYWSNIYEFTPVFVAEVPCIDKAVEQGRISDFLYEHVSNFTERSFRTMFEGAGYGVLEVQRAYDGEVVVIFATPRRQPHLRAIRDSSRHYHSKLVTQKTQVREALERLREEKKTVCFWGGTGKGAAFLNAFDLFDDAFPYVVDSDTNKVGRYVPRTGQEIRSVDWLGRNPMDTIVITTYWRAKDIFLEIEQRGLDYGEIYVVHRQRLMTLDEAGLGPAQTPLAPQPTARRTNSFASA